MRDTLLGGSPAGAGVSGSRDEPGRRFGRLRGGSGDIPTPLGCAIFFIVFFVSFCMTSLGPNEFGLRRNYLSGTIGYEVVRGGLHLTGPLTGYVTFPAAQVTLEYSKRSDGSGVFWSTGGNMADRDPVQTRTGADPDDPDSGGQPISISCAVQFKFVGDYVRDAYLAFGSYEAAKERYLLLTGNTVGNTAQEFTPNDFWSRRDIIAARMLNQINHTLWHQGYAIAVGFEILKVEFAQEYEDSITGTQVAEQQKVVNENDQQVQRVVQSISIMKSATMATIANISAGADADAKELTAHAKRDAFNLKQAMKSQKYAQLQESLGFNDAQMQEYFKIKSVAGQNGKVVIGLPSIGDSHLPATPWKAPVEKPHKQ
mmetsp:Transcript_8960/g.23131  ORF Transcript_8960/g.23131 Transcript_8960/m.23131 type:complete len:371 (+) Transcript_8960:87-1199(+)